MNIVKLLRQRATGAAASSLLTDLVSYWRLDETSGTRFDSVSTNNLSNNNTVGFAIGKIGNAASFVRANNEYLSSSSSAFDIAANEDFALSFWYRGTGTPSPNTNEIILGKGKGILGDPNGGWALNLQQSPQRFQVGFNDASGSLVTGTGLTNYNDGAWHHIAINFDRSGDAVLIVDGNTGTPDVTLDISSHTGAVAAVFDFFLARFATSVGINFSGELDELGFWKGRILTNTEITQLYNSGAGLTYPFV